MITRFLWNGMDRKLRLFVLLVLAFGVTLPLLKTMVVVTFFAGLLPVIGNLISNTLIVIVGVSQGPGVALACLAFLVGVHKLEYFANARIVGWYHTHPDFGIFLSDYDVFIHQHFFSGPGQIALVIDPVRKLEGVFC